MEKPWNWCGKCRQPVDVDECFDGSEIVCIGCDGVFIATVFVDGSWLLIRQPRRRLTRKGER